MSIGVVSRVSDVAISIGQVLKIGSDEDHVAVCGAADVPRYVALQAAAAGGVAINVQEIGTNRAVPMRILASGIIPAGTNVEAAASGRMAGMTGGVGTHRVIGWLPKASTGLDSLTDVVSTYWERVI